MVQCFSEGTKEQYKWIYRETSLSSISPKLSSVRAWLCWIWAITESSGNFLGSWPSYLSSVSTLVTIVSAEKSHVVVNFRLLNHMSSLTTAVFVGLRLRKLVKLICLVAWQQIITFYLYDDDVLIITAYQMNCSLDELMMLYHLFFFKNNILFAFKSGGYLLIKKTKKVVGISSIHLFGRCICFYLDTQQPF